MHEMHSHYWAYYWVFIGTHHKYKARKWFSLVLVAKGCKNKPSFSRTTSNVERRRQQLNVLRNPPTKLVEKINKYLVCEEHLKTEDYEEKKFYQKVEFYQKLCLVSEISSCCNFMDFCTWNTSCYYSSTLFMLKWSKLTALRLGLGCLQNAFSHQTAD